MSLSVSRRKSRRKLHHMAKNLDNVLSSQFTPFISNNSDLRRNVNSQRGFKSQKHTNSSPASSNSSSSFSNSHFIQTGSQRGMKAISVRRENELDLDSGLVTFRIGSITYEMDDMGNWSCSPKNSLDLKKGTITELTERSKALAQENNMLRVKNELLTDMIARKNVRKEKIENELDRLRKLLSTSSSRFSNTDSVPDKK